MKNPVLRQFCSYATIGAVGTAGHYTTLIICVELLAIRPILASTFGFIVGAVINYFLNYFLTFRSSKKHHEALPKFMITATVGMLLNLLIMSLALKILMLYYLLAQVVSTLLVMTWTFAINKIWTFADKPDQT